MKRDPFRYDMLDGLLTFCEDHPVNRHSEATLRRLVLDICSGPDCVLWLKGPAHTEIAALLIDGLGASAPGVFELIGFRGSVLDARVLLDRALQIGEDHLFAQRARIEAPIPDDVSGLSEVLQGRGYTRSFSTYGMVRDAGRPLAMDTARAAALGRWQSATEDNLAGYEASVMAAMEGIPGSYSVGSETFRDGVVQAELPHQLFLVQGRVAGFVRYSLARDGVGWIDLLGRHPDFRGRGLGPLLLTRAIDGLVEAGATALRLDVAATNADALDLYKRFGFGVERSVGVWSLRRSPPGDLADSLG